MKRDEWGEAELRERVLAYLYGEMNEAEEIIFRAEVEVDERLALLLAEEERFQRLVPTGSGTEVPEELRQESRLLLRLALRQEARRGDWRRRLSARLQGWWPRTAQAGGALALLLAGLLLGRTVLMAPPEEVAIGGGDFQVVDLKVRDFDPASGRVRLRLSGLTTEEVEGRLDDPRVEAVLTAALQGDLESDARLQAAELMSYRTATAQVRQALIHALLEDGNPGVRLEAVAALKGLAGDEQVRQALRQALLEDENPGVRVAAIEALREFGDRATLQVLEHKKQLDDNEYIRAEAQRALERWSAEPRAQQL